MVLLVGAASLSTTVPASATAAAITVRVSVGAASAQANNESGVSLVAGGGRYVVFQSQATNLVPGDTNGVADVFLRDRLLGRTFRVSVSGSEVQANNDRSGTARGG